MFRHIVRVDVIKYRIGDSKIMFRHIVRVDVIKYRIKDSKFVFRHRIYKYSTEMYRVGLRTSDISEFYCLNLV